MSKPEIHPQAVVAPSAKLAPGVKVGAYAVVGEEAELAEGCIVHPHAVGACGTAGIMCSIRFAPSAAIRRITFRGERTEQS
jgi:acyl-[acyl carrier protein]--UDP-N-acetylglucosamine O-acyltransferase